VDAPSAAWAVAGHPAGPEGDAGPFADYPSGPMPAYTDDSLLEDLPDVAEPLTELPARPAEVASAGPLADPAGQGPADATDFGPPEATVFGPPAPAGHGAGGAAANGSPSGDRQAGKAGMDGEEGLPPVRRSTPKNPSRRPVVVPPPPGPMDDPLPPVRPPAPPWPGIRDAVAQPSSPPPAAAGRPLAAPVSRGPAALPATAQLTVPPGSPARPAGPARPNQPADGQPDHGQPDGGQPEQPDGGQLGQSGSGQPVAGQGEPDFGPPEPLRLADSAQPLVPAAPLSGSEPAEALPAEPLTSAQTPDAGQAAGTGLAAAALAAAPTGPATAGDRADDVTVAPAAEPVAADETTPAGTSPAGAPPAGPPTEQPAEPPAARPTVTVTGDRGGDRPLRVVERALSGPSDRRGDGWHDRVVVVPGGHRPGQPDFAQRDRARALLQVAGSRRIVVLGCTVGAGQTMTTLMTGEILARIRDEPVAVLDLNTGSGSLAQRAGSMPAVPVGPSPNGPGQGSRTQPSQLAVIGSEALAEHSPGEDSGRSAARVLELLSARYHLTLADPGAPAVPRVLSIADQLLLVAPASADAARAIAMTMEWLEAHGYAELGSGSITVINGVSRPTMGYVEQAEAVARGRCRAIVRVPWDDQLRKNDGPPGARLLGPAAVQAYTALAGVLVAGLATAPEPRRAQPRQAQPRQAQL
jgi:MinD-like ATPase involved in chromosome partitioning or flagellar assembly